MLVSASARKIAGHALSRCSSTTRSGTASNAAPVITAEVVSPSASSSPCSPFVRATRSADTVCMPMAGTAPTTSTASSEPSSPNAAGTSSRAARTLRR